MTTRPADLPGSTIGRLERPAITGVLVREIVNFSSYWRSASFSSTVEPTIYLLAFGFGFGSLVSTINGYSYVEFVGTGTVATAVLFSSAFAAAGTQTVIAEGSISTFSFLTSLRSPPSSSYRILRSNFT